MDVLPQVGLQRRPRTAAGRRYREPSGLLAGGRLNQGGSWAEISCSILPTAKIQNTEAEGFRVHVHAKMH